MSLIKWKEIYLPILRFCLTEIVHRQESDELREYLLRYNVLNQVILLSRQRQAPHPRSIQALVTVAREFQQKQDQLSLLRWLMTILED